MSRASSKNSLVPSRPVDQSAAIYNADMAALLQFIDEVGRQQIADRYYRGGLISHIVGYFKMWGWNRQVAKAEAMGRDAALVNAGAYQQRVFDLATSRLVFAEAEAQRVESERNNILLRLMEKDGSLALDERFHLSISANTHANTEQALDAGWGREQERINLVADREMQRQAMANEHEIVRISLLSEKEQDALLMERIVDLTRNHPALERIEMTQAIIDEVRKVRRDPTLDDDEKNLAIAAYLTVLQNRPSGNRSGDV